MQITLVFETKKWSLDVNSGTTFRELYTQMNTYIFTYLIEDLHGMFSDKYPDIDATLGSANVQDNEEFVIKTIY